MKLGLRRLAAALLALLLSIVVPSVGLAVEGSRFRDASPGRG